MSAEHKQNKHYRPILVRIRATTNMIFMLITLTICNKNATIYSHKIVHTFPLDNSKKHYTIHNWEKTEDEKLWHLSRLCHYSFLNLFASIIILSWIIWVLCNQIINKWKFHPHGTNFTCFTAWYSSKLHFYFWNFFFFNATEKRIKTLVLDQCKNYFRMIIFFL